MSLDLIKKRIQDIKTEISAIRESSGQLFLENELIIAKNTIEKYSKQGG